MNVWVSSFASVPGKAGFGALRQHDVRSFEGGNIIALASAFAMPRLWGYALDAALEGFAEGLQRPHDGTVSSRMHQALDGARKRLRLRVDVLLERKPPDVGLLAVSIEPSRLHVLCCGPGRVFVRRGQRMRRLTPREDRAEGLLKASPSWCVEVLEPGDLVLLGSLSAFNDESIYALTNRLDEPTSPTPDELVAILNADAASRKIGAASLVVRIEDRLTVI